MKNLIALSLLLCMSIPYSWAQDTEPDNNSFAGADSLAFPILDTAHIQPARDTDYYKVTITQCGVLLLNLTNIPGLNLEMIAFSAATVDSVIGNSGYGGNRALELLVSPGVYYIRVEDHFGVTSATKYTLAVNFDSNDAGECNNDFASAQLIADSTSFTGEIRGSNALRIPVTDVDYYKVHVTTCGTLALNLVNIAGLNLEMTVYSASTVDSLIGNSGYGGNRSLALAVSAGDYYIKVDDHFNATSPNPYSLIVAFDSSDVYECNNGFADASPIPDNMTLTAEIRGSNALRNPVIDVDYYKVHITGCGILTLNLTDIPGLNLEMTAYWGANIDSILGYSSYGGNRTLEMAVSTGDIYIKVGDHFSATSASSYTLAIAFDSSDVYECNNSFADASVIPDSIILTAEMRGSNALDSPIIDVDYYKVHITGCGTLVLNLTDIPGLNLEMTAYLGANVDSVIGYSSYGGNRTLELAVSTGDIYIKIDDHFSVTSAVPYTLAVAFDNSDVYECNNGFGAASPIADNITLTAEIRGSNALRTPVKDVDYYKVHIASCGILTLNLTDIPGLNLEMTAYLGANVDSVIGYSSYGGNRTLEMAVSAGDIYIKVDDHFNATSANAYTLAVAFDSSDVYECNNSFGAASIIPDSIIVNAKIRGTNILRSPVNDVDYYKISIPQCGVLVLNLADISGLNLEMTVFSAPYDTTSIGYSSYGGNRKLELLVSQGDYYIKVDDHFNATSASFYSLAISFDSTDACECNNTFAMACNIPISTTFDAKIRGTNSTYSPTFDVDYYKFSTSFCGQLVINLTNVPGLNIEMTLYSAADTTTSIAYSGYGGNRSITFNLVPGNYYLKADDHFNGNSASTYTLALSFTPVATPPVPVITPTGLVRLCTGQQVVLHSSAATNNYWSNGQTADSIIVSNAGIYVDTVKGGVGCYVVSLPDTVSALATPVAGFTYSSTNNNYTFTNTSANGTSYEWKFGDGDTSTAANPVHTFHGTSTYTVTLIVYNSCGADSSKQVLNVIDGINEMNKEGHLIIAPDPCSVCELIGEVNPKDLMITDIIGRTCTVLFTKTTRGYKLDLSGSNDSIYLIRNIRTGEVIKFVKE